MWLTALDHFRESPERWAEIRYSVDVQAPSDSGIYGGDRAKLCPRELFSEKLICFLDFKLNSNRVHEAILASLPRHGVNCIFIRYEPGFQVTLGREKSYLETWEERSAEIVL